MQIAAGYLLTCGYCKSRLTGQENIWQFMRQNWLSNLTSVTWAGRSVRMTRLRWQHWCTAKAREADIILWKGPPMPNLPPVMLRAPLGLAAQRATRFWSCGQ